MAITISGDSPNFTTVAATTVNGVTTLNSSSGVLATQNGMTGIPKAWVNFAGASGTIPSNGSFNVSSVTRNSTGNYTISFTTAMPNTAYAIASCCDFQLGTNNVGVIGGNSNGTNGTKTTSACSVAAFNASFSLYDVGSVYITILSN